MKLIEIVSHERFTLSRKPTKVQKSILSIFKVLSVSCPDLQLIYKLSKCLAEKCKLHKLGKVQFIEKERKYLESNFVSGLKKEVSQKQISWKQPYSSTN